MARIAGTYDRFRSRSVGIMAICACHIDVCTGQSEARLRIMIKAPCVPIGRVVASVASLTEAAAVRICIIVAGNTFHRGIVERRIGMTIVTTDGGMCADQWKLCNVVIEPDATGPACFFVARFANATELTVMRIVVDLAASAVARQIIFDVADMTSFALEFSVARRQSEPRSGGMVKRHPLPGGHGVTATAVVAVATLVHVVAPMTIDTCRILPVAEIGGRVAIATREACVSANECEARQRLVIERQLRPGFRRMTVIALLTVAAAMYVVLTMARYAGLTGVFERWRPVAGLASRRRVGA